MMSRYKGFQEWLLEEGEQGFRNPLNEARNADDPSMRKAVDKAAAELRFRDEVWQANRDRLFSEFKKQDVLTLGDFLDRTCEEIRRGRKEAIMEDLRGKAINTFGVE